MWYQPGVSQAWKQLEDYAGIPRDDGVCFMIDQLAYCGTGASNVNTLSDFYAYSFDLNKWTEVTGIAEHLHRQYAAGFSDGMSGFVFGGVQANGVNFNDMWRYDPVLDQWFEMLELPDTARNGMAYFSIDSLAYVVSGRDSKQNLLSQVWAFDMMQNHWIKMKDCPFAPRFKSSAAANGSKAYLSLGRSMDQSYPRELYEYDPVTDAWSVISVFPGAGRAYAAMFASKTELYIMGGLDSSLNAINDLWKFDLINGVWSQLDSLPARARRGGMWWQAEDVFYYATGMDANRNRLKEVWKYTIGSTHNQDIHQTSIFISFDQSLIKVQSNGHVKNLEMKGQWEMRDLTGKVLNRGNIEFLPHSIPIENIPSGLYLLSLHSQSIHRAFKFVK
ncbi:MAG: hypothetical protein IPM48_06560 [Saprospiraceae bacterium]|nr:hypothetical protein [Saprospiraceae bacterium]